MQEYNNEFLNNSIYQKAYDFAYSVYYDRLIANKTDRNLIINEDSEFAKPENKEMVTEAFDNALRDVKNVKYRLDEMANVVKEPELFSLYIKVINYFRENGNTEVIPFEIKQMREKIGIANYEHAKELGIISYQELLNSEDIKNNEKRKLLEYVEIDSDVHKMGFTGMWLLGLVTGIISCGIVILLAFLFV